VLISFGKGFWAGATSQYAQIDNYRTFTSDNMGISVLIPSDCANEYIISTGMQCKSTIYTYDRGQKEGYLLTVAAKLVSDLETVNSKGEVTKALSGEDRWEDDMKSLCVGMSCYKKTIQGNPAIRSSMFSADENMASFNAESLYIYQKNNNAMYILSVRAANQSEAKLILSKMEESLSWK
jgi:hypothetical protein